MSTEPFLQKILIVDDTPVYLRVLAQGLMDEYGIIVTTSGAEAIEIASREIPDLILLDVIMPDMDGYEVCRRLKADSLTLHIPVIFVTGKDEEADELTGLELGAVDYIIKPFSLPLVRARVRTHLTLKKYRDLLENYSFMDGLTGIPNRRRFDEFLNTIWIQASRQNTPVSLIMMDVDYFKAYNDHYGHQAGDECLKIVAMELNAAKRRTTDLLARYGGEEFVCVLPATEKDGAAHLAEQFRLRIESKAIPHAFSTAARCLTLSLGVASMLPRLDDSPSRLIEMADLAMYRAKLEGRNRVDVWEHDSDSIKKGL